MNRRWAGALIALAAVVLAVAIYFLTRGERADANRAEESGAASATRSAAEAASTPLPTERWTARLFFPTSGDRLQAEAAEIASGESPRDHAAAVLGALLTISPAAPRVPVFPSPVEVGRVILLTDGTLVADLRSAELADPPASGSIVEQLRVYALVHSVLRNVPEATQVVLLWNGRQRTSFSGHVDTSRPLRARPALDVPTDPALPETGAAATAAPTGAADESGAP